MHASNVCSPFEIVNNLSTSLLSQQNVSPLLFEHERWWISFTRSHTSCLHSIQYFSVIIFQSFLYHKMGRRTRLVRSDFEVHLNWIKAWESFCRNSMSEKFDENLISRLSSQEGLSNEAWTLLSMLSNKFDNKRRCQRSGLQRSSWS